MRLPPLLQGRSSEIRGSLWYKILGRLIGSALWILGTTWKYKIHFKCKREDISHSAVMMVWHNRIFAAPEAWRQLGESCPMGFLTSASKDGTLVAQALAVFGLEGVRGSSSRRGVAALSKMKRDMRQGHSYTMTPDGPKGPLYEIKEGSLRLAQMTKCPIIPVAIQINKCWRINTWDKLCIPKPFSTIEVCFNEQFWIPEDLTEEGFSRYSSLIEKAMNAGEPDFSRLMIEDK